MIEKERVIAQAANIKFSIGEMQAYFTVFGIGIIAGFISKRFLKFVVFSCLLALLIVKGLEYQDVLKIDWHTVAFYLGVDFNTFSLDQLVGDLYELVVANLYLSGSALLGFLIGYQAG